MGTRNQVGIGLSAPPVVEFLLPFLLLLAFRFLLLFLML
jgi:hypothetical protein